MGLAGHEQLMYQAASAQLVLAAAVVTAAVVCQPGLRASAPVSALATVVAVVAVAVGATRENPLM